MKVDKDKFDDLLRRMVNTPPLKREDVKPRPKKRSKVLPEATQMQKEEREKLEQERAALDDELGEIALKTPNPAPVDNSSRLQAIEKRMAEIGDSLRQD
jgi:hypothetical protein